MKMEIVYRRFQTTDFLDLATLSNDEWKDTHHAIARSMLKTNGNIEHCILAICEGKIAGYIYGFVLPNKLLIPELLYVLPEYRNNGVGSGLLSNLENTTSCENSMIFYNKSLHKYYTKLGYDPGNLEAAMKILPKME